MIRIFWENNLLRWRDMLMRIWSSVWSRKPIPSCSLPSCTRSCPYINIIILAIVFVFVFYFLKHFTFHLVCASKHLKDCSGLSVGNSFDVYHFFNHHDSPGSHQVSQTYSGPTCTKQDVVKKATDFVVCKLGQMCNSFKTKHQNMWGQYREQTAGKGWLVSTK